MNYRKTIHDQLITDFTALTFSGGESLFAAVKKVYFQFPENTPSCMITASAIPDTQDQGMSAGKRMYSFQSDVMEMLDSSASEAEAEKRIDRLSNIEDAVLEYLQALPLTLNSNIATLNVLDINVRPTSYTYKEGERGVAVYQTIQFDVAVLVDFRNL